MTKPRRRLLLLQPLSALQLPAHPVLATLQRRESTSADLPELRPFLMALLSEAVDLSDRHIPKTFKSKTGASGKASPPSTAKVEVLTGPSADQSVGSAESWFARRSAHEDKAEDGTGSWSEFEGGLLKQHSANEKDYTPGVFDSVHILSWEEQIASLDGAGKLNGGENGEIEFTDVTMDIYEMAHSIPAPLNNRAFATLIASAKTSSSSFILAQVPVDISKLVPAMYSNGRHKTEADAPDKREKVVMGQYTSIERVKKLEDGKIQWIMATASDAKGWLPMSLQKLGIPGAVVKDVGFFIKWVGDRRKGPR